MTESYQESSFVHILRAGVLLAALIAVPGTAVCWNLIPKEMFPETRSERPSTASDREERRLDDEQEPPLRRPNRSTRDAGRLKTIRTEESDLPEAVSFSAFSEEDALFGTGDAHPIRVMKGVEAETTESAIPTAFSGEPAVWAMNENPSQPFQTPPYGEPCSSQRNFSALETQLKKLGAKYYRLEKWGRRGELFRFSCYVSPSAGGEGSGRPTAQQYFQAIDSDEIRVMDRVIEDIKRWKARPSEPTAFSR